MTRRVESILLMPDRESGLRTRPTRFPAAGPRGLKPAARVVVGSLFASLLVGAIGVVYADYAIDWHTIDGGGEMFSTGGTYELGGTIGQHDAGEMTGGTYSLTSGFWFGCVPADCDCDGDVDLHDFVEFQVCFQGPGGGLPETDCACFDFNADTDVDLDDFAEFQTVFTGS